DRTPRSRAVISVGTYSRSCLDWLSQKMGKRDFCYAARHRLATSFPVPKLTTRPIALLTAQEIAIFHRSPRRNPISRKNIGLEPEAVLVAGSESATGRLPHPEVDETRSVERFNDLGSPFLPSAAIFKLGGAH